MTISLKDVGSGYKRSAINSNFQAIEDEINNNLLSKNGGVGLEATLDANSQRIINLANGVQGKDAVSLEQLNAILSANSTGIIASQLEVQYGNQAINRVFTFSNLAYVQGGNNLFVFRNGQKLGISEDYTETSTGSITLTFDPNDDDRFEFITNISLTTTLETTSSNVTHSKAGVNSPLATYLNDISLDFDTLADAVACPFLIDGDTVTLKERTSGNGGGAVWDVVLASTVTPNTYNIVQCTGVGTLALVLRAGAVLGVDTVGVLGSGDESNAMAAALECSDSIDLQGLSISTGSLSKTTDTLRLFSSKPGAKLTFNGAANTETFIDITTSTAAAKVYFEDIEIDAATNAAKGISVTNTTTGAKYYSKNVKVSNCTQTASTGLAAGHYISGGFVDVLFENPEAKTINSTGGSTISTGIRIGQNGTSVSTNVTILNPVINGVTPGNDGDGIAILQDYPFTVDCVCRIADGYFLNCHKRAIKTQTFKTIVESPYIVRNEAHTVTGGNVDIDIQYGNGEIIDPTFDYTNDTMYPSGGIASLNGPRGQGSDNIGNATNVIGGVCNIESIGTAPDIIFSTSTYDALDKVNRPLVSGFTFNGEANHIWEIRPLASATFNDNIVFKPVIRDSYFRDINTSVFNIDRSGTGYAFVDSASLINVSIESGEIDQETLVTTNVGITYDIVKYNHNISSTIYAYSKSFVVATDASLTKSYVFPQNSMSRVTIGYTCGGGNTYHVAQDFVLNLGNGSGEDLVSSIVDETGLGGVVSVTRTWNGTNGNWDIDIDKAVGSGSVTGNLDIIIDCPLGITEV